MPLFLIHWGKKKKKLQWPHYCWLHYCKLFCKILRNEAAPVAAAEVRVFIRTQVLFWENQPCWRRRPYMETPWGPGVFRGLYWLMTFHLYSCIHSCQKSQNDISLKYIWQDENYTFFSAEKKHGSDHNNGTVVAARGTGFMVMRGIYFIWEDLKLLWF